MSGTPAVDPADEELREQYRRTLLAWRRTALSLVAAGLLIAELAERHERPAMLSVALVGTSAVIAFVWLGRGRQVGVTGLALALGVALLGTIALRGVLIG